jgi:hypothetical protein
VKRLKRELNEILMDAHRRFDADREAWQANAEGHEAESPPRET